MDRTALLNAFLPATEIEDPARFSGRRDQVSALADALRVEGSVPLIYGHRGLGKSSLARQMTRIAEGDLELLDHLALTNRAFRDDDRLITFSVRCTTTTASLNDLLQLVINTIEGAIEVRGATRQSETLSGDRSGTFRASLKFLSYERSQDFRTVLTRESYEALGLEEKLIRLGELVATTYNHPVLIVIDEVDRLVDSKGLASFLKTASSPLLKFMLVGIAGSHSELLADHESLGRQMWPVEVRRMDTSELTTIVDQAEAFLLNEGISVKFSPRSKARLARISAGFPWFVHVLGQSALVHVVDHGGSEVHSADVALAVQTLIETKLAQKYIDAYQNAVRDSSQRETLLRLLANWGDVDIPTAVIYPMARNLAVGNPSVYKAHLCSIRYGAPLYQPVFQNRGVLRFQDEMFKVYVKLRPSLFANVDAHVETEYESLLKN